MSIQYSSTSAGCNLYLKDRRQVFHYEWKKICSDFYRNEKKKYKNCIFQAKVSQLNHPNFDMARQLIYYCNQNKNK